MQMRVFNCEIVAYRFFGSNCKTFVQTTLAHMGSSTFDPITQAENTNRVIFRNNMIKINH